MGLNGSDHDFMSFIVKDNVIDFLFAYFFHLQSLRSLCNESLNTTCCILQWIFERDLIIYELIKQ